MPYSAQAGYSEVFVADSQPPNGNRNRSTVTELLFLFPPNLIRFRSQLTELKALQVSPSFASKS